MTWFVFLYRFGILTALTFLGATTYAVSVRVRFSMLPTPPRCQVPKSSFLWQVWNTQPTGPALLQQKMKTACLGRHHLQPSPSQLCNMGCCIHASSPVQTSVVFFPSPFYRSLHTCSLSACLCYHGRGAMELQIFLPVKDVRSGVGPLWGLTRTSENPAGLRKGYGCTEAKPGFWGSVHGCCSNSGLVQLSLWKVMLVFATGHHSRALIQFHTL